MYTYIIIIVKALKDKSTNKQNPNVISKYIQKSRICKVRRWVDNCILLFPGLTTISSSIMININNIIIIIICHFLVSSTLLSISDPSISTATVWVG